MIDTLILNYFGELANTQFTEKFQFVDSFVNGKESKVLDYKTLHFESSRHVMKVKHNGLYWKFNFSAQKFLYGTNFFNSPNFLGMNFLDIEPKYVYDELKYVLDYLKIYIDSFGNVFDLNLLEIRRIDLAVNFFVESDQFDNVLNSAKMFRFKRVRAKKWASYYSGVFYGSKLRGLKIYDKVLELKPKEVSLLGNMGFLLKEKNVLRFEIEAKPEYLSKSIVKKRHGKELRSMYPFYAAYKKDSLLYKDYSAYYKQFNRLYNKRFKISPLPNNVNEFYSMRSYDYTIISNLLIDLKEFVSKYLKVAPITDSEILLKFPKRKLSLKQFQRYYLMLLKNIDLSTLLAKSTLSAYRPALEYKLNLNEISLNPFIVNPLSNLGMFQLYPFIHHQFFGGSDDDKERAQGFEIQENFIK